jgi:hypothetical protein
VSEPPVSLAFFDPVRRVHGSARAGFTLLFEDKRPISVPEGPLITRDGESFRAVLTDRFELAFEPVSDPAKLAGSSSRVCRVTGTVGASALDCLGTATETERAPAWAELDALRTVSAILDGEHAVLAVARRPRGALGHGQELVTARLLSGSEMLAVEEARLSTVYDGDGRQRSAGLELWMPGEDFPRRASGTVMAGASLQLDGLRVNAAVFGWRMEGREGVGAYDVTVRDEPPSAA